jgi:thioredoxin 1
MSINNMSKLSVIIRVSAFALFLILVVGCSSKQTKIESAALSGQVVHINDSLFKAKIFNYSEGKEWKYAGELPCIVDFYADWCSPCRQLSPLLDEMAKKYEGKLIIYKIDTEQERLLTQNIGIGSLPTLIFISKSGKPQVARGLLPKDVLEKAINSILTN